jgi:pilus assembly protein CpaD
MTTKILQTTAILLALTACAPGEYPRVLPKPEATARNTVSFDERDHLFAFRPGTADPAKSAEADLDAFLNRLGIRRTDLFYLESDAGNGLAQNRALALADRLAKRGVRVHWLRPGQIDLAENGKDLDGTTLMVHRVAVTIPDCPVLPRAAGSVAGYLDVIQPGCSNEANLGLMVADPRDLVIGHDTAPAEAQAMMKSLEKFRGTTKSGGKGKGSDLADAMKKAFAGISKAGANK